MQISLLCLGKTDEQEIRSLVEKYEKRLPHHIRYQRIELPDIKNRKNLNESQQKRAEEKEILAKISKSDKVILLDEKGKTMTSKQFSSFIDNLSLQSAKHLIFIIGGPYGFSENVYARADRKISLSAMTFTHQMVRLFFTEQLYRAFSILQGKSYHHE